MEKERKKIEAAFAAEKEAAGQKAALLQGKLEKTRDQLDEANRSASSAMKKLEREREAHAETATALTDLERKWEAESEKREKMRELEKQVNAATAKITSALEQIRTFLEETEEHLNVDLACLSCLGPLTDAQVLVPCGHSICHKCSLKLDQSSSSHDPSKYCPLCRQEAAAEGGEPIEATPVEGFPNTMLDAVLSRLRTKVQDVESLLNFVFCIFDPQEGEGAATGNTAKLLQVAQTRKGKSAPRASQETPEDE